MSRYGRRPNASDRIRHLAEPPARENEIRSSVGTTAHEDKRVLPRAITDEPVFVTVLYEDGTGGGQPILSTGLFALDLADGTVPWSREGWRGGILKDVQAGRVYVMGYSDALVRADPADREQTDDGEWTPEPRTDLHLHVDALNARTGELCGEWEIPNPGVDSPNRICSGSRQRKISPGIRFKS